MKTLNYLDSFWSKAKEAVNDITTELPKVSKEDILKPIGKNMWVINYSDLGNSWSPEDILKRARGESKNLTLLTEKVKSVFEKSPDKLAEFLKSTANKGWFRDKLQDKKVVLTPNELSRLNLYIKENI